MILTTAPRVSAPLSKEHWTHFSFGIMKKKLIWIWGPTAANQGNDASMKTESLRSLGHARKLIIIIFFLIKMGCPQAQLFSRPPLSMHHFIQYSNVRIPQGSVISSSSYSILSHPWPLSTPMASITVYLAKASNACTRPKSSLELRECTCKCSTIFTGSQRYL